MSIEFERKFLIYPDLLINHLVDGTHMVQDYLCYEPAVRIRVEKSAKGKHLALLSIKAKGDNVRLEFNYEVPFEDGMAMFALCGSKGISKTRFRMGRWIIDEFHADLLGLWVAEFEPDYEGEPLELPAWVRREVTKDERYTNGNLLRYGIPSDYTQ